MADDVDISVAREERAWEEFHRRRPASAITFDTPQPRRCAGCGVEIPMARLLALPHARLCVHCAERAEL